MNFIANVIARIVAACLPFLFKKMKDTQVDGKGIGKLEKNLKEQIKKNWQ